MHVFTIVFLKDLKLIIKDWKSFSLMILLPILMFFLFYKVLSPYIEKNTFIQPFRVAVADLENSIYTRMLVNQLEEIEFFSIERVDEDEAYRLLSEDIASAALIIPEGFTDSMVTGENKPVTVTGNSKKPMEASLVKSIAQAATELVSAGQSAINTIYHFNMEAGLNTDELENQFMESLKIIFSDIMARKSIFIEGEFSGPTRISRSDYYIAALIPVFVMLAALPFTRIISEEKESGVYKRLKACPYGEVVHIISKLTVFIILSLLQTSFLFGAASIVSAINIGIQPFKMFLLFLALIFSTASFTVFISVVSSRPLSAYMAGITGVLAMSAAGGSIYSIYTMPDRIRWISGLTINRWALEGFLSIITGNTGEPLGNYILPLLSTGVVFLLLSGFYSKLEKGKRVLFNYLQRSFKIQA